MQDVMSTILVNLEQVGIGILLFLAAYVSNMFLGAWRNVSLSGDNFDWTKIAQSIIKFVVLGLGIGLLSIAISVVPMYITYVGLEIAPETLESIDSLVIIGSFLTATLRYVVDCISKIKDLLGINNSNDIPVG